MSNERVVGLVALATSAGLDRMILKFVVSLPPLLHICSGIECIAKSAFD